jgi:lipase maturation factor 1
MFNSAHYTIIAHFFPRLLGLIYLFAFGAFLFQIRGLIGKNGILPIGHFLERMAAFVPTKKFYYIPSLFWLNSSNAALMGLTAAGTLMALALVCGPGGLWPALLLFLLYFTYLSIVSTGQDFLGFGWEGFLLEVTLYAFLISLTSIPNPVVWVAANFLLFRFHFNAGAVKLQSHDRNWRNLTAIAYHYQSQPLPNTIAWYVHKLPLWFHKLSVLIMFTIELLVAWGLFLTDEIRLWVFAAFFGLQFMIWVTGNFSFLNHLTLVLCTLLLSDRVLTPWTGAVAVSPTPLLLDLILGAVAVFLLALQLMRFINQLHPSRRLAKLLGWTSYFHLVNPYGIFAIMTTERIEIVVEGSDDGMVWKEYTYRFKPSEVTRRPRRISPYQPRIDWQAWFLPFGPYESRGWYQKFLVHLLLGTPDVLTLIRHNPFPDKPPKYVRSLAYLYEFSSFEEKRKYGWWWRRTLVEQFGPTLSLKAALIG